MNDFPPVWVEITRPVATIKSLRFALFHLGVVTPHDAIEIGQNGQGNGIVPARIQAITCKHWQQNKR